MDVTTPASPPLAAFALVTDVQYADVDDGWDFHRVSQRYYRGALRQLEACAAEWLRVHRDEQRLAFAVDLGDALDGKNRAAGTTRAALAQVQRAWAPVSAALGGAVHHLVGNHELYNLSRAEFHRELLWPPARKLADGDDLRCYYDFTVPQAPRYRFVVLDSYGLALLGRDKGDATRQAALDLLRRANPNEVLNSPDGLQGVARRFVAFNGAVDDAQLEWLRGTLARADAAREHVLLFSHIPLHPATAPPSCLLWNFPQVLEAIAQVRCVRAVFSGHSHNDGYVEDRGTHFVSSDAILECAPHETAHAVVELHADRVRVRGYGKIPTRELRFPTEDD